METEIEEEKNVSTYNDENQGGSRYLTSKKSNIYLHQTWKVLVF